MTRHVEHVMGTAVSFDVRGGRDATSAIAKACAWLHRIDRNYSTYRVDSPISRLARRELAERDAADEIRGVLDRCRDLESVTGGAFDLYATGPLDPSGYVKGWAVQQASDLLTTAGHHDHLVNGGGDLVARGGPVPDRGWEIGICDPADRTRTFHTVRLRDRAMATSSRSERGAHVPLPPAQGADPLIESVTVLADDLGLADAWATAVLAGGWVTARLAAGRPDLEIVLVTGHRELLVGERTPSLPAVGAVAT